MNMDSIRINEPFTSEDAKELAVLLGNKSFGRALDSVLTFAKEMDTLSAYDLKGQEGLAKALEAQGNVRGIIIAFEQLITLAQVEDEENVEN